VTEKQMPKPNLANAARPNYAFLLLVMIWSLSRLILDVFKAKPLPEGGFRESFDQISANFRYPPAGLWLWCRTPSQRHWTQRDHMKRTRRIEITRYRRTVTQSHGGEHANGRAEEVTVIETAANEWNIPPEDNDLDIDRLITTVVPPEVKLTRTPFNFRRWLRQKF
jgi:hypothetical protein